MSRTNKVNPGQYTIAGRLTPDDLGRERQKQVETRQASAAPPAAPAPKRRAQSPRSAPARVAARARGRVRARGDS
jgi:hypothetical protein